MVATESSVHILSHRGYWKTAPEKNTNVAFDRSFQAGFGTETDLRDFTGRVVISHDPPKDAGISFDSFLQKHRSIDSALPLALNIKSDGLSPLVREMLIQYEVKNYFVFDMSIPDSIGYLRANIRFFSRQSEYEPEPAFYDDCSGVWLDCFRSIWYGMDLIQRHLRNGKQVCLVSPELHGRDRSELWDRLKEIDHSDFEGLMLCTDVPEEAQKQFHE